MKKIFVFLLLAFFIGCSSVPIQENVITEPEIDTSDLVVKTNKLIDYMLDKKTDQFGIDRSSIWYMDEEWQTVTIYSKQNLTIHDYFPWHWNEHTALIIYSDHIVPNKRSFLSLTFFVKEYQEFVTANSRGFILYTIQNHFAVCNPEYIDIKRIYHIVCGGNIILPVFPDGYINEKWSNLTQLKAIEEYEKVLDYWLDKVSVGETEEEEIERTLDNLTPDEDC